MGTRCIAIAAGSVVISEVQVAGASPGTSAYEYINVYNNTSSDVDITNWCLSQNTSTVACVAPPNPETHLYLMAGGSVLFMNPTFESVQQTGDTTFRADILFNAATNVLATTNGSLQLFDAQKQVVDMVGWGSGAALGAAISGNIPAGSMMQRLTVQADLFQNTGNNSSDFAVVPLRTGGYVRGGLYEYVQPIDMCLNSPDTIDIVVPTGYIRDEAGNCYEDLCDNLAGLQEVIPNGYTKIDIDCQPFLIQITELLPNPSGADAGREFIELHNPNKQSIDLSGYSLQVSSSTKRFVFGQKTIDAGGYIVLSDTDVGFSLPNTSGVVTLALPDGQQLHQTASYASPKDDSSWSLFGESWQYSVVLTPGAANELPSTATNETATSNMTGLEPCGEGKYRNPKTNRCKTIETETSLQQCNADQERNPETNRCRKISVTSSLAACAVGQERNPETNRCRKIESEDDGLKPCVADQERNPETNRCRKKATIVNGTGLSAAADPAAINSFKYKLPVISVFSVALLGYGAYEYRTDIANYLERRRARRGRGRPPD